MNIENRIREIREEKKIKQIEVATALNMDNSQYAKLEKRGNKLSLEQIEAIAKALGVSVSKILGIDNSDEILELRRDNDKLKNDYDKLSSEHEEWRDDTIKLMDKYEILNLVYHQSKNEVSSILSRVETTLETLYSNTALEIGIDYDAENHFKIISKKIFRDNFFLCVVLFDSLNIVEDQKWIFAWEREKVLHKMPEIDDIIKLMKQYNESDEESFRRILNQVDKQRSYKFSLDEIEEALEKYRDYKSFFAPQYPENK
jgi:transcriptional regulator with XRE-family HTH domain